MITLLRFIIALFVAAVYFVILLPVLLFVWIVVLGVCLASMFTQLKQMVMRLSSDKVDEIVE